MQWSYILAAVIVIALALNSIRNVRRLRHEGGELGIQAKAYGWRFLHFEKRDGRSVSIYEYAKMPHGTSPVIALDKETCTITIVSPAIEETQGKTFGDFKQVTQFLVDLFRRTLPPDPVK